MIVFNICQIKIGRIGRAGYEIADAQQLPRIPQLGETIAVTIGGETLRGKVVHIHTPPPGSAGEFTITADEVD
jgi:hypothetical protein